MPSASRFGRPSPSHLNHTAGAHIHGCPEAGVRVELVDPGGEGRIKAARLPARKTLEEFDSSPNAA